MTTSLLIINTGSRYGDSALSEPLQSLRGAVETVCPDNPESLPDLIRERAAEVDQIILCGGDGTINLALDALLEVNRPVGLIPTGTANDLARSLEIPTDPEQAVEIINAGHQRRSNVSRVNGVSFINAFGMGIGPQTTREMDDTEKSKFGALAYLLGLIRAQKAQTKFKATISSDTENHVGSFLQITVGNGIHYGGGMTISDKAELADGRLDVLLVKAQSRWKLLSHALRFKFGAFKHEETLVHWRCSQVEIETDRVLDITADGEFLTQTPAQCKVLSDTLNFFAPQVAGNDR